MIVDATDDPSLPKDVVIRVFPNPFQFATTFAIEGPEIQESMLNLYDVAGQLVDRISFNGNQFTFYRNDLPAGLYFFIIMEKNQLIGKGKFAIK